MNKRNFGRVIRRIEANRKLWKQNEPPYYAVKDKRIGPNPWDWRPTRVPECGAPYCFLGHAEFLRTGQKYIMPANGIPPERNRQLARWLGVNVDQLELIWRGTNRLATFKRWHKAGKVPE